MEVTRLLDIHTREELYRWYQEHHQEVPDFWLRINRAEADCPGVVRYVDAVEVALCFGWIDSTMKRIDDGKPIQHFTPRRKGSNWCEQNLERCRRLVRLGEMTAAGLAVAPDLDPERFVFEDWVIDSIKADKQAWKNYKTFPPTYRRIKIDRIQHYQHTGRPEYAQKMLQKFILDCHAGRMQSGWSDFGRLGEDRPSSTDKKTMDIRLERPADYRAVEILTREAFWNVYRPGCTEHFVLHRYRNSPDFIPELDFVMEEDGRLIGHVMFSKAELVLPETPGSDRASHTVPSWTFGPISIHPDYKRKGYGLRLLKYALEKAREMGVGFLCMEGNIDFYKHAGFGLASRLNIHYHAEPADAEVPYFLAQELIPGWLASNGIAEATYCPPKGYFVADEDPEAFEAYEAGFPPKEKKILPGQLP